MKSTGLFRAFLLAALLLVLGLMASQPAEADPSFGLDPPSPSAIGPVFGPGPGHIFDPPILGGPGSNGPVVGPTAAPLSTIPSSALGLGPGADNVDGISYGDDCIPAFLACLGGLLGFFYPFSVDRPSLGVPGAAPDVASQAGAPEYSAAADIFTTPAIAAPPVCGAAGANTLIIDGDGLIAGGGPNGVGLGLSEPPTPPVDPGVDDLDSLDMTDATKVDFAPPWDGVLDGPVFFTLDGPSAAAYGVSPADVLVAGPPFTLPGTFMVWAPAATLGLDFFGVATDDIDALAVNWGGAAGVFGTSPTDGAIFSLAPGSASLGGLPGLATLCWLPSQATEADVWFVPAAGVPAMGAVPLLDAEMLGLRTARSGFVNPNTASGNDNLDALDVVALVAAADADGDGLDDVIDPDDDNEGLGDRPDGAAGCSPTVADTDGDGLSDLAEVVTYGTNCAVGDSDGDGLSDGDEVLVYGTDPLDADSDDDGLTDGAEVNTYGTNPLDPDSDDDGLTDGSEVNTYGTNPLDADSDDDGLTDGAEVNTYGTNPLDADSDDDGLGDGAEVFIGSDPLDEDTDNDGLRDGPEVFVYGTSPIDPDSDNDGLGDGDEVFVYGTSPTDADTDNDGLTDGAEVNIFGTNPLLVDTDMEGCADSEELGPNPSQGGMRNPLYFWDFIDVPSGNPLARDQVVGAADIAAIVSRFGSNDMGPGPFDQFSDPLSTPLKPQMPSGLRKNYHPAYDRGGTLPGGDKWDLKAPNGSIGAMELANAVAQFGHSCARPP